MPLQRHEHHRHGRGRRFFFAPHEVPRAVQLEITRLVVESGLRRLVVESLPQFITDRVLGPIVRALGDVQLEIGIGLQSADDLVREVLTDDAGH